MSKWLAENKWLVFAALFFSIGTILLFWGDDDAMAIVALIASFVWILRYDVDKLEKKVRNLEEKEKAN